MFNPRNLSYDAGIIIRDLVSLQTRHGRVALTLENRGLPLHRRANHGQTAISR
jgi:hypothetical protein